MDNFELENEIEIRMNPQDFSLSSSDLIDIMNQYDLSEHDVAFAYSKIVDEKREEILDTTKDVVNMFREKGNYYPSFDEFKKMFNQYDGDTFIDDNILRDMHKRETRDANQTSMFEIREMIKEQFRAMMENDDFDKEAAAITKNWGGEIKKSKDAMLSPEDIFDLADAGAAAKQDIQGEFGEDEFIPMSDDEYKAIMKDLSEDLGVGQQGLFKPQDSQGNDINLKALVTNLEGTKKGRVLGFGDDGQGNQTIRVNWAWPMDMKFMAPEEMGDKVETASELIVQGRGVNENDGESGRGKLRGVEVTYADGTVIPTSMAAHLSDEDIKSYFEPGKLFNIGSVEDNMQAVKSVNIFRENINENNMNEELNQNYPDIDKILFDYAKQAKETGDESEINKLKMILRTHLRHLTGDLENPSFNEMGEESIDEARGLGHGVKNSGDRNVKKSDDNSHAPVTTLPEGRTFDEKIKTLSEGSVKKKDLLNFIKEEATKLAQDFKGEK